MTHFMRLRFPTLNQ
ncbi:erythromycin resistance leader peptide (plasmid) [Priestia megaterium]|uniref:Erythromycin resistance leader peptide n=2 Tax=Bacillaceae TaxID=186817 RepID=A0ABX7E799_9BACI|nr:erythromycin resistance leader peptide [Cytobacillus citreus]MDR4231577.1 hypothetical protein [Priestia megaterium]NER40563.1 erythromycin resistance leader peptide [Priestia megaterium NBRC 15308 = ATCC 14581]NRG29677.1 erythromycin resistance leader peptide [Niallia circulans]QQZ11611.1 erythromycin resistance leader peptide [Heyndrickxia vini]